MAERWDVVVVGSGNAGLSAAHAAREHVERVLVLEKAPAEWAGGNSYFTAGAIRTTFDGLDDLRALVDDLDDDLAARTEVPAYGPADYAADMQRVTQGRCDPLLTSTLVRDAAPTMAWLRDKGLRFRLMYDRQSFVVDGVHRFWGGLALGTVDGGQGLVAQHLAAAARTGIEVRYGCPVVGVVRDGGGAVTGVRCAAGGQVVEVAAGAVVLAAGGFEANPRLRAAYLGPNWDVARVRGTPYNTGEVLEAALDAGAQAFGHWSGCHAIQWDAGSPPTGDRQITNLFSKQSYPIGIVVNREGRRFLDEGADFRNYTYAKYGAEILAQPAAYAVQLFDAKTEPLLRQDEYTAPGVSRVEATTIRELAERTGVDPVGLERTVAEFNAAIRPVAFDPSVKDGKGTVGIDPPKSNWAQPLDTPPYYGFPVTCGVTFTFGGVRIDPDAAVLDQSGVHIPGLFAAGELVGGLFFHNYPGGSGLSAGAVFGRRAGHAAAATAAGS